MVTQLGDCYRVALENLKELTELLRNGQAATQGWELTSLLLVHGSITPPVGPDAGRHIKHAWVEVNGDVLEMSNGNNSRIAQKEWNEKYKAKVRMRYSHDDAIAHAEKSKHYGPWDEEEVASESVSTPVGENAN